MQSLFFFGKPAVCELWLLPEDPDGVAREENKSSRKSLSNRENASSRSFVYVGLLVVDEPLLALVSCTLQDVMGSLFGIPWWFA